MVDTCHSAATSTWRSTGLAMLPAMSSTVYSSWYMPGTCKGAGEVVGSCLNRFMIHLFMYASARVGCLLCLSTQVGAVLLGSHTSVSTAATCSPSRSSTCTTRDERSNMPWLQRGITTTTTTTAARAPTPTTTNAATTRKRNLISSSSACVENRDS